MGISRHVLRLAGMTALSAVGRNRVYMAAQGNGLAGRVARSVVDDPDLEWLTRNWSHVKSDGQNPRINQATIDHYLKDPDLGGWTKDQQTWGDMHLPLQEQMRGLILPALEARIREGAKTVVEIGSSNGDVIAWLADRHPDTHFIGVDFELPPPGRERPNVTFIKGYALELLEAGELRGDVVFASSTFCLPTPVELRAYADRLAGAGFGSVLIADPVTRAYSPETYPGRSMHQTFGMWGHDHRHVFGQVGYRTTSFSLVPYTKHKVNKDLRFQIVRLDL